MIATSACSTRNQERAQADAKRAGEEIKVGAKDLSQKVNAAVQPDSVSASDKMKQAEADARHATLLAKVKAKLAADDGLSTLTNIDVSVQGSVAILAGSVDTEDQKKAAATVASEVDGITRVDNRLTVR